MNRLWLTIPAGIALLSVAILLSQPAEPPKSEEYLLLGSSNRGAGEPWVYVNPRDPNNIIVAAMATLHRLPTGEGPLIREIPFFQIIRDATWTSEWTNRRIAELSTPDGSLTDIAITQDGGKTWTFSQDDVRQTLDMNRCADTFAGAGPDGTLYVGCLAYLRRDGSDYDEGFSPNGEARTHHGGSVIEWSTDKGKTWSKPVVVHPAVAPELFPPNVHPVIEQVSPWDRPNFGVDPQTGTIYLTGMGSAYTVEPSKIPPLPKVDPGKPGKGFTGDPPANIIRRRSFIRASKDGGKTWGLIYPMDNDEYPGSGGGYSAAFGHLVVAYTATNAPQSEHASCPCLVLGISDNDGKSFAHHILPPLPESAETSSNPVAGWYPAVPPKGFVPAPAGSGLFPGGAGGRALVAADPSKEGRYAVSRQSGNRIYVSVTEDGGKDWLPPVLAAESPSGASFLHQAMKYSPQGKLGLIWKTLYGDGSFDVWSAASLDGARSFKTVRISRAVSPPCDPMRCNFLLGDDLSSIDIDGQYLYAVWGDNRAGFQGTWFGKVPLGGY